MNTLFTALKWLKNHTFRDLLKRRLRSSGRKSGCQSQRPGQLSLERLEERNLLSVSYSVSGTQVTFDGASSDNLYLQVMSGDLQYNIDGGSTFTSVMSNGVLFPVNGATIQFGKGNDSVGTLYFVGMDTGGGTYSSNGPIEIQGDLTTGGQNLSISSSTITVDSAVVINAGTTGNITFTANNTDNAPNIDIWNFLKTIAGQVSLDASISIGSGASLAANNVTATATAGENIDSGLAKFESTAFVGQFLSQISTFFNQIVDLPVSAVVKESTPK